MSSINIIGKHDGSVPLLVRRPTWQDKYKVIVTLAGSLLLIASLSLALYYAIHPIPPMVQITPDFALSLPVVICSSIGMGLITTLLIQISINKPVAEAFKRVEHATVRSRLHQGGRSIGTTVVQYKEANQEIIDYAERRVGSLVSFTTRDGVQLSGYWGHTSDFFQGSPTVLLFHGNLGCTSTMTSWGWYYKQLGFNVLMVEYRGYGLSEGVAGGPNQELEAYLDAEAALNFVLSKNIPKRFVVAHGLSLGGAYAAALGYFFGVKRIILDHTFTSVGSVVGNWVPFRSWDKYISSSYIQTKFDKHPDIRGAKDLVTDGFNTLAKVKQMKGEVLVICGKKDRMMPPRFGQELMQVRYPDDCSKQQACFATIGGGHNYAFNSFLDNREAQQKHWAFLFGIGVKDEFRYRDLVDLDLLCTHGKAKFQEGDQGFIVITESI